MRQASSDTIAELYLAHKDMVYRVCLRFRRGDPEWAADRMQEVFLRLAERWDQLPEMDSPKAFIYRTTMNVCINQVRREQNLVTLLNRFFHKEPSVYTAGGTDFVQPEKAATDAQWLERLDGALASLPVKQRVVVIMYMRDGEPVMRQELWLKLVAYSTALGIVILSIFSMPLLEWASQAVLQLF